MTEDKSKSSSKGTRLVELTRVEIALVVTLLFRLLFGGYLVGMDQYRFHDTDSALTVLLAYGLIGLLAARFLCGKRDGLIGIIGLDAIFITAQSIFTILTLCQIVDLGSHSPLMNWWGTLLMYLFSLLTIIFSIKANREAKLSRAHFPKSSINP